MKTQKFTACVVSLALAGMLAASAPLEAQRTSGLVNVVVTEVIDDIEVEISNNNVGIGVAAQIAANVCGTAVQVGVLAQLLAQGGSFSCKNALGDSGVDITQ